MIKCSLKAKQYSQRAKEAWENFTRISLLHCYFNVIYARCGPIINIHLSHEEILAIAKSNIGRTLQHIYIYFFFFNKTGKYAETTTDLWKSLSWKNMKNIQIEHFSCDVWLFNINVRSFSSFLLFLLLLHGVLQQSVGNQSNPSEVFGAATSLRPMLPCDYKQTPAVT